MPIDTIDYGLCNGCGQCDEACSSDVIRMYDEDGEKLPRIDYRDDCASCYLCKIYCPTDAITVTPWRARPVAMPW